jgi:hypothetical protein
MCQGLAFRQQARHPLISKTPQEFSQVVGPQHILRHTELAAFFKLTPDIERPTRPLVTHFHGVKQQRLDAMMLTGPQELHGRSV